MSAVSVSSQHWLADRLCDLLASPHVALPARGGMILGPGPIDQFTTRFNDFFTSDAAGEVDGLPVDREGLKEALLSLQHRWNPENVRIVNNPEKEHLLGHTKMSAELEWTPKTMKYSRILTADAEVKPVGGSDHIGFLSLRGDLKLFRV